MKFFRDSWRESFFILAVVVIAVKICTLLLVHKNISGSLFDSLVGGIISAGIIGFIVAFVVYIIQQRSDLLNKKQTATAFYETRFLPDIRELFSRNVSPWNVNGANKFYFDNSYTNSIYDLYEKYTEAIFEYHKIFPRNRIVNCIKLIYRKAREGYVLGEKIDQFLGNRIRLQLAPLNIEDHMDKYLLRYLKARLFTKESQKWAEAYTGIPTYNYYSEIYKNLSSDSRIISMQNNVKDMRKELEDEIAKLRSLRMIEA